MPNWEERINPSKIADRTAFDHDMYGIEVEVEYNASLDSDIPHAVRQFWQVVPDGSLRNYGKPGDQAVEFRYTKPLNSFTSAVAVKNLCNVLSAQTNEIYNSGRTSTHVHVNVCNINRLQIMNLITLSIIFDEYLVAQHHPFRSGNLFALRYIDAEQPIRYLADAVNRSQFRNFTAHPNYRYSSVNLASIASFGTVEFRSMDGEINAQRINQWVFCLHQLKRLALKYQNPREIIQRFHKIGALSFLTEHIPSYYIMNISTVKSLEMLSRGIILAADLAYSSDWVSVIEVPGSRSDNRLKMYQNLSPSEAQALNQVMQAVYSDGLAPPTHPWIPGQPNPPELPILSLMPTVEDDDF